MVFVLTHMRGNNHPQLTGWIQRGLRQGPLTGSGLLRPILDAAPPVTRWTDPPVSTSAFSAEKLPLVS